jgi:hypothetical protein
MESPVVEQALCWVAWLYRVPAESLERSDAFGSDLKPSSESFYGDKTLEVITEDVVDMERALKEEAVGAVLGFTVGDFCRLVERLNSVDPAGCQRMLRSWQRIRRVDQKPRWRRLLFKAVGF